MYNESTYALGAVRSCIRQLYEYGRMRAEVVGAENIFDFSLGNPSIPSPKEVNQAIVDILRDTDSVAVHGYSTAVGDLQTRAAVCEDLNERFSSDITPQELFIGCGASMELAAVIRALAFPGAQIVAIAPYFPEYKVYAQQAGVAFSAVAPDIPDFQIPMDALEQALTENTAAVIINSPNNPSGTVYTHQTLCRLAELLQKKAEQYGHPIYIISDEPYRELVYDGTVVPFIPQIYPDTIVCYSYSKSLSLPGARIGYIYVPRQAHDAGALYTAIAGASRACGHVCAPSLMQKVIARCTRVRPDLQAYDRNRRTLYEGLVEAGYTVAKPDGAFYLFVKAPGGSAAEFSERAKKYDVLVVPGDDFGCPEYFRICYCTSHDTIVRSLPLFEALIKEYD